MWATVERGNAAGGDCGSSMDDLGLSDNGDTGNLDFIVL
jgi:hypothetical protein